MGRRFIWAAAVCLAAGWVASRGAAAAELSLAARGSAAALASRDGAAEVGQRLAAQVEALENRLLADRARVRLWRELQERHEGVTSVTCANLAGHAEDMARIDGRRRPASESRRRLAAARFEPRSD